MNVVGEHNVASPGYENHSWGDDLIIGVSLNNLTGITGRKYGVAELLKCAALAEDLGFDAVWLHDAPLGRRTVAAYDPIALMGAIASVTKRVKIGTGILVPQLRNPVQLALGVATAQEASNGRVVLGVGTGAGKGVLVERQYEATACLKSAGSVESAKLYNKRGKLFEESLSVIRRLWNEDKVTHKGKYYEFDNITLGEARPAAAPPILIGAGNYYPRVTGGPVHHDWATSKAGTYQLGPYKRVAELGDGWITPHATPTEYRDAWNLIEKHAAIVQPGKRYMKAFNGFVNVSNSRSSSMDAITRHLEAFHGPPVGDDIAERWGFAGPPESVAEELLEYVRAGARTFQLVVGSHDQVGQMRLIAAGVLPALRQAASEIGVGSVRTS